MPGASGPRLKELNLSGVKSVSYRTALRSEEFTFSKVVISNYLQVELLTELIRAKASPLHVRRSYFGPQPSG